MNGSSNLGVPETWLCFFALSNHSFKAKFCEWAGGFKFETKRSTFYIYILNLDFTGGMFDIPVLKEVVKHKWKRNYSFFKLLIFLYDAYFFLNVAYTH